MLARMIIGMILCGRVTWAGALLDRRMRAWVLSETLVVTPKRTVRVTEPYVVHAIFLLKISIGIISRWPHPHPTLHTQKKREQ